MIEEQLALKEIRKDLSAAIAMLHIGKHQDALDLLLGDIAVLERQVRLDKIQEQRKAK
ncbi:MAG: hypothetical protein H7842_02455 [Gammaproteobacteria bacterium SHHR-1]